MTGRGLSVGGRVRPAFRERLTWERGHGILWIGALAGVGSFATLAPQSTSYVLLLLLGVSFLAPLVSAFARGYLIDYGNRIGVAWRRRSGWDPIVVGDERERAAQFPPVAILVAALELMGWAILVGFGWRIWAIHSGSIHLPEDPTHLNQTLAVLAGAGSGLTIAMLLWAVVTVPGWSGMRWRKKEWAIADPLKGWVVLRIAGPLTGVALLGRLSNELTYETLSLQLVMQASLILLGGLMIFSMSLLSVLLYVLLYAKVRTREFHDLLSPRQVDALFIDGD